MTQNRGCIPEKDKHFSLQHLAFSLSLSTAGPSCCPARRRNSAVLPCWYCQDAPIAATNRGYSLKSRQARFNMGFDENAQE